MDGGAAVATEPVGDNAPVRPAPFRTAPSKKKIGEIVAPQSKTPEVEDQVEDQVDDQDDEAVEVQDDQVQDDQLEQATASVADAPKPTTPQEAKSKGKVSGLIARMRGKSDSCLLYTSPSPRDRQKSRMPSSA